MMVILFSILLFLLIYFFSIGFSFLIKGKIGMGSFLIGVPTFLILSLLLAFFYFFNQTTPSSLAITIQPQKNHQYLLNGTWKERMDHYSFKTDFLLFYVPNQEKVTFLSYHKGDWKPDWYNFGEELVHVAGKNQYTPQHIHPQIIDIQTEEEFQIAFTLPSHVSLDQVTIQYVHVRSEPMDAFTYWVKTIGKE